MNHSNLLIVYRIRIRIFHLVKMNFRIFSLLNVVVEELNHVDILLMNLIDFHHREVNHPMQLNSLKLILKSVLFTEFERFILLIDQIENLIISFSNTEHDLYCFDQYLFGDKWLTIANHIHHHHLQLNILIHRTFEIYTITDLLSNFHWFNQRIICQTIKKIIIQPV